MGKQFEESRASTITFNRQMVDNLERKGYKYFQIRGFTIDGHYDYMEPHYIILVPVKTLPVEQAKKDIYEPINSKLLQNWAARKNEYPEILILNDF
jgi:hypothetical protein